MTVYAAAARHAWWMAGSLLVSILFVLVVEQYFGYSTLAFGAAIVGLIAANRRMLSYNCTHCGKNLFFRGMFVVPWPNRICGRCGEVLDQ